jgi:hypothetical protein
MQKEKNSVSSVRGKVEVLMIHTIGWVWGELKSIRGKFTRALFSLGLYTVRKIGKKEHLMPTTSNDTSN